MDRTHPAPMAMFSTKAAGSFNLMRWILILSVGVFSLKMKAQQAPSLRCLEVINATGDVKLTWLAPPDPQNNYYGFEVWSSNTKTSGYALVFSGPAAITTLTYVHTTTLSVAVPVYYYVKALYANGTSTSVASDTLRTIFLNINTTLPETYQLYYNSLGSPPPASSSATYEISREFPAGTWNPLANTTQLLYNDTMSICNPTPQTKVNYQIKVPDNSGCYSLSNLQGGVYRDLHAPYMPIVDSISVLPNGNTVIAWKIPWDKDLFKYEIQQRVLDQNHPVDSIFNTLATSYTLTGNAATTGTVGLFVKAIDLCRNGSVVDYGLNTMHLEVYYNYCNFQAELKWNHYIFPKRGEQFLEELAEYQIFYSADSGATFSKLGVSMGTSYTHTGVPTEKPMLYFIRVVNKKQTMTASSNRKGFYSGKVPAPAFAYIKTATVIKKNTIDIRVYLDPLRISKGMEVQRSDDGLNWTEIGKIEWTGKANYTFQDEFASTDHHSYYYRVLVRDSCNNIRLESNTARTILLRVTSDDENVFNRYLTWSEYQGFDADVGEYHVYRAVNDVGSTELIAALDASSFSFVDNIEFAAPLGARVEYLVEAVENGLNKYGIKEKSSSNYHPAYMDAKIFVPNAFAPAGINKTWKPVTHFVDRREYDVFVYDRWGQPVYQGNKHSDAWNGGNLEAGVYTYIIFYKNSRGEYQEEKGSVLLIR